MSGFIQFCLVLYVTVVVAWADIVTCPFSDGWGWVFFIPMSTLHDPR